MRPLTRGLIAGAAGTLALDVVGYLDMAVRGRPPSMTPHLTVRRLEELIGVDLGEDGAGYNRRSAIGALLGYATGLAVGVAYATVARHPRPWPEAAALLATTAMVASDVPMTLTGITDLDSYVPPASCPAPSAATSNASTSTTASCCQPSGTRPRQLR